MGVVVVRWWLLLFRGVGSFRSGWEVVRRVEVRRLERREGSGDLDGPAAEVGRGVLVLVGWSWGVDLEDLSWRSSSS